MDETANRTVAMRACLWVLLALWSLPAPAFVCPVPPPAIVTVTGVDFYIDDKHSVIDPRLEQQSVELNKPLRDAMYALGEMADGTGRARDPMSADCALQWLRQWARNGAFTKLGRGGTVERAVAVASATDAYRVVLRRIEVPAEDRALIGGWFVGLARSLVELENSVRPGEHQNNVTFWSALAVHNIGTLQRDEHLKRWAGEVYQRGLGSLNADGFFANEIKRGRQALRYQWFALAPLVAMYVVSGDDDGLRSSEDTARLRKALAAAQASLTNVGPMSQDAGTEVDAAGIRDYALTRTTARLSRCVSPSFAATSLDVPPDRDIARDWRLGSAFAYPTCVDVANWGDPKGGRAAQIRISE
jgi:hypothetical protein